MITIEQFMRLSKSELELVQRAYNTHDKDSLLHLISGIQIQISPECKAYLEHIAQFKETL